MKTFVMPAAAAFLLIGATAQAQGPMMYQPSPYIGGDALFWELDFDAPVRDFDSTGLRLRAGVAFNDYFALEGHLGTGGSDGPAELDYLAGGYAKGMLPITPRFKIFGLLGATEVDFEGPGDSESDVSYGGGASYAIGPNVSLDADYMRYLEESTFDFNAVSLGATFHF